MEVRLNDRGARPALASGGRDGRAKARLSPIRTWVRVEPAQA
jgi:hypothetical protein